MKFIIPSLLIGGSLFVYSCDSSESTNASHPIEHTKKNTPAETQKADLSDFDTFWNTFYNAVKNSDKKTFIALMHPSGFSPNFMEDTYSYFFEGDLKKLFLELSVQDIKESAIPSFPTIDEPLMNVKEVSYDNERAWLYFALVNDEYKLVSIVAPG